MLIKRFFSKLKKKYRIQPLLDNWNKKFHTEPFHQVVKKIPQKEFRTEPLE
jgi:hypothetical protein